MSMVIGRPPLPLLCCVRRVALAHSHCGWCGHSATQSLCAGVVCMGVRCVCADVCDVNVCERECVARQLRAGQWRPQLRPMQRSRWQTFAAMHRCPLLSNGPEARLPSRTDAVCMCLCVCGMDGLCVGVWVCSVRWQEHERASACPIGTQASKHRRLASLSTPNPTRTNSKDLFLFSSTTREREVSGMCVVVWARSI
jgi:hypothetical protein